MSLMLVVLGHQSADADAYQPFEMNISGVAQSVCKLVAS
jgi:hypothetical protein